MHLKTGLTETQNMVMVVALYCSVCVCVAGCISLYVGQDKGLNSLF